MCAIKCIQLLCFTSTLTKCNIIIIDQFYGKCSHGSTLIVRYNPRDYIIQTINTDAYKWWHLPMCSGILLSRLFEVSSLLQPLGNKAAVPSHS